MPATLTFLNSSLDQAILLESFYYHVKPFYALKWSYMSTLCELGFLCPHQQNQFILHDLVNKCDSCTYFHHLKRNVHCFKHVTHSLTSKM